MFKLAPLLAAGVMAGMSPQTLLTTLLNTPVRDAELPHGFSHAQIEKQPVSANGRKYRAVGLVDVALAGADAEDALAWVVFSRHADAIGDLDHPALASGVKIVDTVPGLRESLLLTGTLNGKKVTDAAAVVGNVLVQGVVASSRVRASTAILLLKAAIAHLRRVG
jgi:hypothetical protein